MTSIIIAEDFSRYPAGRFHPQDGDSTGQKFRDLLLIPALKKDNDRVMIYLDGTVGYPSSFLEESFGGLVRNGFSEHELAERIELVVSDENKKRYILEIWEYIKEASS